jgi:hypothetical protein
MAASTWTAARRAIVKALRENDVDRAARLAGSFHANLMEGPNPPKVAFTHFRRLEGLIEHRYALRWAIAQRHRERAEHALAAGNLDEARAEIAAALKLVPYDPAVNKTKDAIEPRSEIDDLLIEARVRLRCRLYIAAQAYIDDVLRLDSENETAKELLAELRRQTVSH